MTVYDLSTNAYQSFNVPVNEENLTITLRYMNATEDWIVDIEGVAKGVTMTLLIPIFTAYGYPGIYFVSEDDTISRDLTNIKLVVLSQDEIESLA